jgi:hypothetical protein
MEFRGYVKKYHCSKFEDEYYLIWAEGADQAI